MRAAVAAVDPLVRQLVAQVLAACWDIEIAVRVARPVVTLYEHDIEVVVAHVPAGIDRAKFERATGLQRQLVPAYKRLGRHHRSDLVVYRLPAASRAEREAQAVTVICGHDFVPVVLQRAVRTVAGRNEGEPRWLSVLSTTEHRVLALICQHRTDAEIADELDRQVGTVKKHVSRILQKLGADDRRHAARIALGSPSGLQVQRGGAETSTRCG